MPHHSQRLQSSFSRLKRLGVVGAVLALAIALFGSTPVAAEISKVSFDAQWKFARFGPMPDGTQRAEPDGLEAPSADDGSWRVLDLPHDWGVEGPFRAEIPGNTGKLPWAGIGWYRKSFTVPASDAGRRLYIDIDGAMSQSKVWLNGKYVGEWPYGYASFRLDLTQHVKFGEMNVIAIRLDNPPESSRWYPGGGLYRHVWLSTVPAAHLTHGGVFVRTPVAEADRAEIEVDAEITNLEAADGDYRVRHEILPMGAPTRALASVESVPVKVEKGATVLAQTRLKLQKPALWSVEKPVLHLLRTTLLHKGKAVDSRDTVFGIRSIAFSANDGFQLNGKRVQLKGVCEHHDLGALGAAINTRALERKLEILREMGCNSVRTSHNPPAPELLDLCDRMGFLVLDEAFDCWEMGKTKNDYSRHFKDWHERDLATWVRRDRNHPSVILWSSGNEIREQGHPNGAKVARHLTEVIKKHDPTRLVTAGLNNANSVKNGFAKGVDVIGINYKPHLYAPNRALEPNMPIFGAETSSTVSSRGEYFFPVLDKRDAGFRSFQVSSYDLYFPPWAHTPDTEWEGLDRNPYVAGEYVWTGFDYLGEPTPYQKDLTNLLNFTTEAEKARMLRQMEELGGNLPSRSSYFGIIDLCGFPKDRYYLYQSRWRPELPMAHILPHWTWPERNGEVTPVHVYTSGDEAELFLNGKTLGRKKKGEYQYRLRWDDVRYEAGELRVVAYKKGKRWAEAVQRTAGAPARLEVTADRKVAQADGQDLVYLTVRIIDAQGVVVPRQQTALRFSEKGPADVIAVCNGDATSFEPFQAKTIKAYNSMAQAILRSRKGQRGQVEVTIKADGLPPAVVRFDCR